MKEKFKNGKKLKKRKNFKKLKNGKKIAPSAVKYISKIL